jgi:hypothetical protein
LTAGCTDTTTTVFILRNQAIAADCSVPSTGGMSRSAGTLDVTNPLPGGTPGAQLVNPGYIFSPAIVNGTSPVGGMPNVHTIFLQGANVEIRSDGSAPSNAVVASLVGRGLSKRTPHFSATVAAGQTAGVAFPIVDADQTDALGDVLDGGQLANVFAHITVYGSLDGSSVTSDPFDYPVALCKGCRILDLGDCADLTKDTVIQKGGNCNVLQDGLLSCCTTNGMDVCPAAMPKTTDR